MTLGNERAKAEKGGGELTDGLLSGGTKAVGTKSIGDFLLKADYFISPFPLSIIHTNTQYL